MDEDRKNLAIMLFSEVLAVDQKIRNSLGKVLPKGMEISHFSVLNHLAWHHDERTPAELAKTFRVTRGAMTNTISKLEWAGFVHIRPDWDDARRKLVAISPAGKAARDDAFNAISPMIIGVVEALGEDNARSVLPILREMRKQMT